MNPASIATTSDVDLAYQLVLGRRADEEGLQYFSALARAQSLTPHDIAKFLIGSEEFKKNVGGSQEPVEIKRDGYSLFVRSSDRDIGSAIEKGICYEPHVSALLRRELSRGDTFLDVGANIGHFTMLAAHLVGPSGKVVAVEPMDKNLQLVYLGIEKNGFANVEVFPFGASDRAMLVPIVTDPNTSNALVQTAESKRRPSLFAPTRTLDGCALIWSASNSSRWISKATKCSRGGERKTFSRGSSRGSPRSFTRWRCGRTLRSIAATTLI